MKVNIGYWPSLDWGSRNSFNITGYLQVWLFMPFAASTSHWQNWFPCLLLLLLLLIKELLCTRRLLATWKQCACKNRVIIIILLNRLCQSTWVTHISSSQRPDSFATGRLDLFLPNQGLLLGNLGLMRSLYNRMVKMEEAHILYPWNTEPLFENRVTSRI